MNIPDAQPARVLGDKVWCPLCRDYVKVVRVTSAAKIVDVDRRTVYNYVKMKKICGFRIAGNTLRVCSSCSVRANDAPHGDDDTTLTATRTTMQEGARQ